MLSVIIPSRNEPTWPFLQKTIDDLFMKAMGEMEVIVILDGFVPDPPIKPRNNLKLIYHKEAQGMRQGINLGASMAKGNYIMKCDDHCMFGIGFDIILEGELDWLSVPSRYALNKDKWLGGENDIKKTAKYGPVEYLYLTPPHVKDDQFGWGLRGKKWMGERGAAKDGYFFRENARKHIKIDDIISFQGSCWHMSKYLFERIGGMQEEGYRDHQEAQELGFKVWLSGGRCVVNKNTSYSHLHKGDMGRGYPLLRHHQIQSQMYSAKLWLTNSWSGQIKTFKSLIEHLTWYPMDKWNEVDLDNIEYWRSYDYSKWMDK